MEACRELFRALMVVLTVTQTRHNRRMVMLEAINTSQPEEEEERVCLFFSRRRKCLTNEPGTRGRACELLRV